MKIIQGNEKNFINYNKLQTLILKSVYRINCIS